MAAQKQTSQTKPLFWLHIKKSAGITTRALLQPYYLEVDRDRWPKNFIQASPEEYNDVLNNYRVVLGKYQFKRCQFAKKYLYPDTWDDLYSFAFSREPVDRCVSMFYYVYWQDSGLLQNSLRALKTSFRNKKLWVNTSYEFDLFLDLIIEARKSDSIFKPLNNHFTTHTAEMWGDISDENGVLLLKNVIRLEALNQGLDMVFEKCGIEKKVGESAKALNVNLGRKKYTPSVSQRKKIENIFADDFDVYESAWH